MSDRLLLRARTVLPVSGPPIEDGAVLVGDGRICAVGAWGERPVEAGWDVVDLGESIVLPGLINAHCHLDYTHLAGELPPPRVFTDWIKQILAAKAAWNREDYAASWAAGAEMLRRSGTTTVLDIEAVPDLLPSAWAETPLRVISCLELISIRDAGPDSDPVKLAATRLESLPGARGRVGLSPHAPYSTQSGLLRAAAAAARDHAWPVTIHIAESAEEFEMFMYRRGPMFDWLRSQRNMDDCGAGSPVRHVEAAGLLGPNCLAAHVNHLWDGDAEILARTGTGVVHCPRSHGFFGHHRFPADRLASAGVNLCLGTDSLASTSARRGEPLELDLFAEMQTYSSMSPAAKPETIVRMVTENPARALGLSGEAGQLRAGARADLIVVPQAAAGDDPWEAVVWHRGAVAASMVAGQWVVPPAVLAGSRTGHE